MSQSEHNYSTDSESIPCGQKMPLCTGDSQFFSTQSCTSDISYGKNEDHWLQLNKEKMPFYTNDSQLLSSQSFSIAKDEPFATSTPFLSQDTEYNSSYNVNDTITTQSSAECWNISSWEKNETIKSIFSETQGSNKGNESDTFYTAKSYNITFDESK